MILTFLNGMLANEALTEVVELHNTLNPKIWGKDNQLISEVKSKIEDIVNTFVEKLSEDNVKLIVDDIYILGSNANFNYTDESDLDIHIIADETFDCNEEHLAIIYNAYKTLFNKKYDITINGINVELYVENKDALSHIASGVYSLNNGWIKNPTDYHIPKIENAKLEKLVQEYENKYLDIVANPSIDIIDEYLDNLYDIRIKSIQKDGEFGLENLLFKELRHLGYIDELKELKVQLENKALSLE